MALHEQAVGATDEWYTPAHVFEAMGVRFDSDPAPGPDWTPARQWSAAQGVWRGFVWLNPPFGGRNAIEPWLRCFMAHGDGVALTPDRTSAPWWQRYARDADALLFVSRKIRFIGADRLPGDSPAQGTTLMAKGERGVGALERATRAGLGLIAIPWRDNQ